MGIIVYSARHNIVSRMFTVANNAKVVMAAIPTHAKRKGYNVNSAANIVSGYETICYTTSERPYTRSAAANWATM